jgi:hypothetical protein
MSQQQGVASGGNSNDAAHGPSTASQGGRKILPQERALRPEGEAST